MSPPHFVVLNLSPPPPTPTFIPAFSMYDLVSSSSAVAPEGGYAYSGRGDSSSSSSSSGDGDPPLVVFHLIAANQTKWTETDSNDEVGSGSVNENDDASGGNITGK